MTFFEEFVYDNTLICTQDDLLQWTIHRADILQLDYLNQVSNTGWSEPLVFFVFFLTDMTDDQDLEPSKFLLPTEDMETANIPSIYPETHARLEAAG